MRNYELMCIIHPDLDETAFSEALDKVKGWIADSGGDVVKVDKWGRRKLAYLIRKLREGQYVLLHVNMEPTKLTEFERNMRFHEPVIRYMITAV